MYDDRQNQMKKLLIIFFVISVLLGILFLAWRVLFFGNVTVTVDGYHDPVNNLVYVNEKSVYPTGAEGKTYRINVSTGTKEIKLTGPYIKPQSTSIDVSGLSEAKLTLKTVRITKTELANSLLKDFSSEVVSEIKTFGELENWLVIKAVDASTKTSRNFFVFFYDTNNGWTLAANGEKIDIRSETNSSLPDGLADYLEDQAGD